MLCGLMCSWLSGRISQSNIVIINDLSSVLPLVKICVTSFATIKRYRIGFKVLKVANYLVTFQSKGSGTCFERPIEYF